MKTHEEILLNHLGKGLPNVRSVYYQRTIEAMSEVEQQTREEMFEFVKWWISGFHPFIYWIDDNGEFITDEADPKRWTDPKKWTVEELFDYWKSLKKL